jgi:hypothetical protein
MEADVGPVPGQLVPLERVGCRKSIPACKWADQRREQSFGTPQAPHRRSVPFAPAGDGPDARFLERPPGPDRRARRQSRLTRRSGEEAAPGHRTSSLGRAGRDRAQPRAPQPLRLVRARGSAIRTGEIVSTPVGTELRSRCKSRSLRRRPNLRTPRPSRPFRNRDLQVKAGSSLISPLGSQHQ